MSKIAKASANKKHNIPDFGVIGNISPEIIKKVNGLVVEKKANEVIDVIDYINNRIQTKITNISVDTWDEAFETDLEKKWRLHDSNSCNVLMYKRFSIPVRR